MREVKIHCFKCRWEQSVLLKEQKPSACPTCGEQQCLMINLGYPDCLVCGRRTLSGGGSTVGACWVCPEGHYREHISKESGHWCKIEDRICSLAECSRCWNNIHPDRLDAIPDTKLCVQCSEVVGSDYDVQIIEENLGSSIISKPMIFKRPRKDSEWQS